MTPSYKFHRISPYLVKQHHLASRTSHFAFHYRHGAVAQLHTHPTLLIGPFRPITEHSIALHHKRGGYVWKKAQSEGWGPVSTAEPIPYARDCVAGRGSTLSRCKDPRYSASGRPVRLVSPCTLANSAPPVPGVHLKSRACPAPHWTLACKLLPTFSRRRLRPRFRISRPRAESMILFLPLHHLILTP